jgi:hypothetical protein
MLSEACAGEAMKSRAFLSGINGSKGVARIWIMMKEMVIKEVTKGMRKLTKCEVWHSQTEV